MTGLPGRTGRALASPRAAAYAVALSALALVTTIVVGVVGAVGDVSRIAAVEVTSPRDVSCLDRWCTISWTVTSRGGPVGLERVLIPREGPSAAPDGRRLLGLEVDGEPRQLPDLDASESKVFNAFIGLNVQVRPGTPRVVDLTVGLSQECPPGGFRPVAAAFAVTAGDILDQHFAEPVDLPCR